MEKKIILNNLDNIDWTIFLDTDIKEKYNSSLKDKVKELRFNNDNSKLNYETFSKFIMTSANESTKVPLKMNLGWYDLSSDILKPLMDEKSRTLDLIRQNFLMSKQLRAWRDLFKKYKMELNYQNQDGQII